MRMAGRLALVLLLALVGAAMLLAPAGSPPQQTEAIPSVWGEVRDERGTVAGARVRFKGTARATLTDEQGRFRLPLDRSARRVTAWKEGFLIAGTTLDRSAAPLALGLVPLPAEDFAGYEWVDPAPKAGEVHNCGNCHGEIYREWSRSAHARSATGARFLDLYAGTSRRGRSPVGWGLLTQYPEGAGVCTACHAPGIADRDPALFDLCRLQGVAAQGVHCDYCHKIAGVADGQIGLTHGRYNLRLQRPREGQLFFGPLDDVDRGEDAYSPLYHDSHYCASCHEGIVFGVHVYSTYSEWLDSPARREGKQCQDCHMKPTGRMSNMAPGHGGIERNPRTLANHRFFDGSRADMLRRAVRASAETKRGPDGVSVRVWLGADGVGHRVPTGFIDRHLLLVVEGRGEDGSAVSALQGPKLPAPAGLDLAGRPGRLYAKLLQDDEGRRPAPFWLAAPEPPLDTRLFPGRTDETVFLFPSRVVSLRLRVLYRPFWQEVTRAKGWPDDEIIVVDERYDCRADPSAARERP
jgi:hypothetical protein